MDVREGFRMIRFLGGDCPEGHDYLASHTPDGHFQFTTDRKASMVIPTWEEYVALANALWLTMGPFDLTFQRVYVMSLEVP